jgi:tetratricopeptide (TPR) repeat protein
MDALQSTVTTLIPRPGAVTAAPGTSRFPVLPWKDPHSVSPEHLAAIIVQLEQACVLEPENADLRTCLGIVHAMNYDPYRSMDALEEARNIDPGNFLAQFKYAELLFRLRALDRAEEETHRAVELANNHWEVAQTRHQLSEIRRMLREGTQKPTFRKSLVIPVAGLSILLFVISILFMVKR